MEVVAIGSSPDGAPVIISGGRDATVRVRRLADGTPVGEPLRGHTRCVNTVTVGELPDGTPVIVSGSADGTVRVWRLADGAPVGEPLIGHDWVHAVAVGGLPDGTPVIVSGSDDGTVRVWRLAGGALVRRPERGPAHDLEVVAVMGGVPVGTPTSFIASIRDVEAVAVGGLPDGTSVVVSRSGGVVQMWRLADGSPISESLRSQAQWMNAGAIVQLLQRTPDRSDLLGGRVYELTIGGLPDGTLVIIGRSEAGTVRVWRLADRTPVGEPVVSGDWLLRAVSAGGLPDGTPVIVGICRGGDEIRVWRLADGAPIGEPLRDQTQWIDAVAVGGLPDGTPVIVGGGGDATVRVWRLTDGRPLKEPLRGHTGRVNSVAVGGLPDGTPVILH